MAESKFEISKREGIHKNLADMAGEWEGTTKVWFEFPGEPVDQSPMSGKISVVLGGRFIRHEYTGSMQGQPLEGIMIFGYEIPSGKYQSSWVDSFHTGTTIMFFESKESTTGKPSVYGSYKDFASGTVWGWKIEMEMSGPDNLMITMYNIMPDGLEVKAVEIDYKRKK